MNGQRQLVLSWQYYIQAVSNVAWNLANSKGEKLSAGIYLVALQGTDPQSGQVERKPLKLG